MAPQPRSIRVDHHTIASGILVTRPFLSEVTAGLDTPPLEGEMRVDEGEGSVLARYMYEEAGDLWLMSFAGWCESEEQAEHLLAEILWHLQEDAVTELVDPMLDDLEDILALGDMSNTWRIRVEGRPVGTISGFRIGGSVMGFLAVGHVWDDRDALLSVFLPRLPALRRWRAADAM